ncbi:MAG: M28 family metallopeptidase, partial [Candidatus Hodarchaeales archaeon]
ALSSLSSSIPFNYDIYFVAFNGEEAALYGSFEVVDYLVKIGKEVLICINADMILYNDPQQPINEKQAFMFKGDDVLWSSAKYEEWGNLTVRISSVLGEGYIYTKAAGTNDVFTLHSDHGAFWLKKFPALFVHSGRDQYYHRPEDTLANPELNLTYPLESAKTTAVLVYLTSIYGRQVLDLSDHDGDNIDTQLELIQGTYELGPVISSEDLILDSTSSSYIDNLSQNSSQSIDLSSIFLLLIALLISVHFRKHKGN